MNLLQRARPKPHFFWKMPPLPSKLVMTKPCNEPSKAGFGYHKVGAGIPNILNPGDYSRYSQKLDLQDVVQPSRILSKLMLTPHLTLNTQPYTFTPFLNPPTKLTFQNYSTQTPPKSHTEIPNTIQNTKHKPKSHTETLNTIQTTSQHNTKPHSTNKNRKHRPYPTPHIQNPALRFHPISQPA